MPFHGTPPGRSSGLPRDELQPHLPMTNTATEPLPASTSDTWTQQLTQLKTRYKHVREPVLVALNILMHDQNIALDDAKAQANLHGVRITAASINAARTLLSRMEAPTPPNEVPNPSTAHRNRGAIRNPMPKRSPSPTDSLTRTRSMPSKVFIFSPVPNRVRSIPEAAQLNGVRRRRQPQPHANEPPSSR